MSRVLLLSADKPLPLCDCREERSVTAHGYTVSAPAGFSLAPHEYYRDAVAALHLPVKAYCYELSLELCAGDLHALRTYLRANFAAGEEAELWNLWLGDEGEKIQHFRGAFSEFDLDSLAQFLNPEGNDGGPGCCRMNITM